MIVWLIDWLIDWELLIEIHLWLLISSYLKPINYSSKCNIVLDQKYTDLCWINAAYLLQHPAPITFPHDCSHVKTLTTEGQNKTSQCEKGSIKLKHLVMHNKSDDIIKWRQNSSMSSHVEDYTLLVENLNDDNFKWKIII